ncbi:hypothetical protein VKT23_008695 [Stygiomarasmius scandens]|uniref:Uncharacterized protein n=1 Tax=Marasmiellus scandens TaxID=2682957 RepID=A0ABR1JI24_9AGAR
MIAIDRRLEERRSQFLAGSAPKVLTPFSVWAEEYEPSQDPAGQTSQSKGLIGIRSQDRAESSSEGQAGSIPRGVTMQENHESLKRKCNSELLPEEGNAKRQRT